MPPRRRVRRRRNSRLVAIAFVLPALALNLLVIGGPTVSSIGYSFTDWNGITTPEFVGLENWRRLVGDEAFWNAIGNNFVYLLIFLTVPMAMGLVGAFMLSRIRRGAALFRVLYFIPYLLVSVITAQIWRNILDPEFGLASALNDVGIHWLDEVYFFADGRFALYSVAFVDNWHFWGFLVVLFLAAMQGIDAGQYEAARIDGANAWQEFWHIVLPGIRPTLTFALTIVAIGSLLVYDYPFILTGGGPAGATDVASLMVNRTAFLARDAGYGSAIALALSVLSAIFLVLFGFLRRREEEV
ncbi:carbohydrate ABC transporter permease [Plantactinospora endophytica]|uniref:ABC transporter permease n=1 Tax=Plantactinospora endophytica TaxID=673535 RepID=A0ABQ4E1J0_9ACTN|nr:sugar ABC transporter permease [Plantactinospora endophytica]GIG88584.1 ABC transporter permease [Plantactinospora endophytica]